ncbi:MAG: ATP-binding protein, partial [Candidatus Altiarchaeota archaeon]|nr:ATP-binding protein [Candidatus Altiarchaeota archaeon]
MLLDEIGTTKEVKIPQDPIKRVIGQNVAVDKVKLAVRQWRHLLLVGPPGIGKSMLAQALAYHLEKPTQQISVLHNQHRPHHPIIEVMTREQVEAESRRVGVYLGKLITPGELPYFVAERLGYRCSYCGITSKPEDLICPKCGSNKYGKVKTRSPVGNVITEVFEVSSLTPEKEVYTTRISQEGREEAVVYQRVDNNNVRVLDQKTIEQLRSINEEKKRNIIVPLNRKNFVHATGASETELLGDVRHDPYGSHPEIGTPAYLRVVPGAIHEAHEGVLFIDELPHLDHLQNFILTAMQE